MFTVDDKEYIRATCDKPAATPCLFVSAASGSKLFSTQLYPYSYVGKTYVNKQWITENKTGNYYVVKFLGHDKEINTKGSLKQLMKNMYNHDLITEAGDLDASKLDEFITIYGEKNPNAIEVE